MTRAVLFLVLGLPLCGVSSHLGNLLLGVLASLAGVACLGLAFEAVWKHGKVVGYAEGHIEGIGCGTVEGIEKGKHLGEDAGRAAAIGRPMHQDQLPNGTWLVLSRHVDPVNPFIVLRTATDKAAVPLLVVISRQSDFLRMTAGKPIRSVRSYSGGVVTFDHPESL